MKVHLCSKQKYSLDRMPGFYGSCNPIEWIGTSPPSFSRLNLQERKPFGLLITFAEAAGEPES